MLLLLEIWRGTRLSHYKHGVCPLLQAKAGARTDGDEATAAGIVVWCRCCCDLATRRHSKLAPVASGRMRVFKGTAGCAGPRFSTLSRRQSVDSETHHGTYYRGETPLHQHDVGVALCRVDSLSLRVATEVSARDWCTLRVTTATGDWRVAIRVPYGLVLYMKHILSMTRPDQGSLQCIGVALLRTRSTPGKVTVSTRSAYV